MANQYGPRIITDGLLLCIDSVDKNSYISGSGVVNDLSGNSYNFSRGCIGTSCLNPAYTNNAFKTSFTATTHNFLDCTGTNSTSTNLLYGDHTIEVICNINSLSRGIDLNAAYTTETRTSLVIWPGYHSGLNMDNIYLYYEIWNSTTNTVAIAIDIRPYVGKNIILHAVRISNTLYLYINGVLITSGNITAPSAYSYANFRIGCAINAYPISTNGYSWPSNVFFYSVKLYNQGFTRAKVIQNFNALETRFGI